MNKEEATSQVTRKTPITPKKKRTTDSNTSTQLWFAQAPSQLGLSKSGKHLYSVLDITLLEIALR